MNSLMKIALAGGALIVSSALLVSFTNDNGGDKKKKYQIIHHSNGEVVTYDTLLPMSSTFTPEQFVAEMGISAENIDVIKIPSISDVNSDETMMKTFIHEVDIEEDDNGIQEAIEIRVEMDDSGEMKTKKTVNGVEVEMTEDELIEIKNHHGKVIQMRFDDEETGESDERIEISVEMDNDGKKTIKKTVNGEEVEISEDEMDNIQLFELSEIEGMDDLELEIERLIEEGGDENVKIITKRIDINSDSEGNEFNFESTDGKERIMVMSNGESTEDHTIVLVTENYDESTSPTTKMMFEQSSNEMDVYPNPNNGSFKIRYKSDENEKTSITVTDASGRNVFEENLGKFTGNYEKELNLKEFGSGMYTITIRSGSMEEVQKVMVK